MKIALKSLKASTTFTSISLNTLQTIFTIVKNLIAINLLKSILFLKGIYFNIREKDSTAASWLVVRKNFQIRPI